MKNYSTTLRIFVLAFIFIISNTTRAQVSIKPIVRLSINTATFTDETVFYFEQGGTSAFQSDFDAYKLIFNAGYPYIGSLSDSILTSISGLPELTVNISAPVKAITPTTGSFTFTAEQTDFPVNVCVTLYDAYTGMSTNILSSDYVCTLYDTTTVSRFTMHFFTTPSQGTSNLKQATCGSASGMISAKGPGSGPWDYEWRSGDSIVKTCLNKFTADSLGNLNGGSYSVKINCVGQCDNFSKTFALTNMVTPTASFVPSTFTTSMSNSGKVDFVNKSTGAQFNSWNFGDNTGAWFIPSASYNYLAPGIYTVTLICESITHCKDTAQQVIWVVNDVTGINENDLKNNLRLSTFSQGYYALNFAFGKTTDLEITLMDLKGTVLKTTELKQVTEGSQAIDLQSLSKGMYLVKIVSDRTSERTFKLLN